MRLSEALQEAIRLSEASRRYWERELPKHHPRYPIIRPGEDSGPPPPEEAQLNALLSQLSDEQLYTLILLMYIGRGDYPSHHLAESYQSMRETFPKPEFAISQMIGKLTLDEYLLDGLAKLRMHNMDVDKLALAHAAASKSP